MYPPTKHCGAYRREDDGSGGAGSGREAETTSTAPNSTRGAMRGHGSGRSGTDRSRVRRVAQDSTPTAYMYTPSGSKDAQIARPAQYPPTTEGRSPRSGCPSRGEYRYPNRGRTMSSNRTGQHRKANERRHSHDAMRDQRQKKSLVRLRSSSCEATVWTEAGIDLRNTAP